MRLLITVLVGLSGCVIQHDDNGQVVNPTPTAKSTVTARPTLPPPLPTLPPPTPTPTARPNTLVAPSKVLQCEKVLVLLKGPYQKDDVVIWADKKHHVGRMFFDEKSDQKYLGVKLNTAGARTLDIKINGAWALSHPVLVEPKPENCNLK